MTNWLSKQERCQDVYPCPRDGVVVQYKPCIFLWRVALDGFLQCWFSMHSRADLEYLSKNSTLEASE